MPEYIKLAIGADVTFTIMAVEVNTDGEWPDYHFVSTTDVIYTAPKSAIDRQLERLTLGLADLPGLTVNLERAKNEKDAKKSWWNLNVVSDAVADESPAAPPLALPTEARRAARREAHGAARGARRDGGAGRRGRRLGAAAA
jgi:hypothetical protein